MSERISHDFGYTKHDKEISFFNSLIIDLKLYCLGKAVREPITMARMEEATRHIAKLSECREQRRFYR